MSAPRFSIVTPAHNAERHVESTIRSVLLQTEQDFELIVVDDGSNDRTRERAAAFADDGRIRLIEQPNRGPSAARNAGIAAARGELVSMLDSDDLWLPSYLEVMGESLDRRPDAGLAYTDAWVLSDETGKVRRTPMMHYQRPPRVPPRDPRRFLRLLLDRNFVYSSVTVRRSVLDEVGGFDERLWTAEDWELWLRIAAAGHGSVRAPGRLAIHRMHENSLSADLPRMLEGVCDVYRIVAEEWPSDREVQALARARRRRHERSRRLIVDPAVSPSPLERVQRLARSLKRAALRQRLWLAAPPADVAATLRETAPPDADRSGALGAGSSA